MRIMSVTPLVLIATLGVAACTAREVPAPPPPEVVAAERQDSPERLERSNTVRVTAAVTNVDVKNRLVTLKNSEGLEQTIVVGPEVRNLDQVKRGDNVTVTYQESVVFQLYKPGEAKPGVGMAATGDRAKLGDKPGAAAAEVVTVTGTVEAIDREAPSLTLKSPDGEIVTLPVRDASRLDPVRVGDLLEITYSQALAIAVEKPTK